MPKSTSRPRSKVGTKAGTKAKAKSGVKVTLRSKPGRATAARSSKKSASSKPALQKRVNGGNSAAKLKIRDLTAELTAARGRIDELEAWAETDFLLDIANRRGFERSLVRALAYIKRYPATGALIAIDVDRLKPINDSFGHAAGDAVLKGIVNVVLRHVRSSDVVGRLGGDEFAVLLWNVSEAAAFAKAAALEQAIDRLTFVFRGRSIAAGASAGVTALVAEDNALSALERADLAMYARKKARREAGASDLKR
jgi:diguanylate cyclase (GGDEF)-like protein